jgi:hypothetical protein
MAGLDPAIQQATSNFVSFMDGPIKSGHDGKVCHRSPGFFHKPYTLTGIY